MSEIYQIKIGMIGAYYPEDWEYKTVNSFNDFINILRSKDNPLEELIRISWDGIENILCLEYDLKEN